MNDPLTAPGSKLGLALLVANFVFTMLAVGGHHFGLW